LPSNGAFNWNGDTGLSRDSAGVIDVGNGTAGNISGSMKLTNITISGTCSGAGCGSSPLTTNGDLFFYSGGNARLPVGSNGNFLFATGGLPAYDTLLSDTGGLLTYTGSAGIQTPSATLNGSGAGLTGLTAGTDNSSSCPASSVCDEAPTSVGTSYTTIRANAGPAAPSVKTYTTLSSGKTTESFTPTSSLVASVPFGNAFIAQSSNATIPIGTFTDTFTFGTGNTGGWTFNPSLGGAYFPLMQFFPAGTGQTVASGQSYLSLATDNTSAGNFVTGYLVDMEGGSQSGSTQGFLNIAGTSCTITVSSTGFLTSNGSPSCINATNVNLISYPGSYTSGGIPYAVSSSSIGASALLAANVIMQGGGAGTAPKTGNGDFTIDGTAHTLLSGASGLVDLSLITGSNGFKGPVKAGLTVGANGAIGFDSTNSQYHGYNNGVDSIFAAFPTALGAANNDCVKWVKTSNNYALGDAGACAATPTISALSAATGSNTTANAAYQQNWNFVLTGASGQGMAFGETSASTGGTAGAQGILSSTTASASTATPLIVTQGGVTGTTAYPAAVFNTTWNNASLTGAGIVLNITNTSSASGSSAFTVNGGTGGSTLEAFIDPAGGIFHSLTGYEGNAASTVNTVCGGLCNGSNNGLVGGLVLQGSTNQSTGSSAKGGYAILVGGGLIAGTPNAAALEGAEQVASNYLKGSGVSAVGDVVCGTTTAYTVTDCTAGQLNAIGIAQTTTNPIGVVAYGKALVKFDGAVTLGDIACGPPTSTGTTGQAHDNGTSACPSTSSTIGIIVADAGSITSFSSGGNTATTAMSTTLAEVQLHIAP
jgi:hypothetical protein